MFDAIVSTVVLYGFVAWALTQAMEGQLHVAWRRMLRYVFCLHRKTSTSDPEDWVSYMQRTAHAVDGLAASYGLASWVAAYRKRKCGFAGRVARQADNRWSTLVVNWRPQSGRHPGRPCTRWTDDLEQFAGGSWQELAQSEQEWALTSDIFAVRPR